LSDETQVGTGTENTEQPVTETIPQESGTPTIEDADPRFKGKSQAELVEHIRNQEKLIGKQSNDVGQIKELRQQLNSLGEYVQSLQRPPERQQQQQPEPQFDITDPNGWLKANMAREMNQLRQELAARDNQRYQTDAQTNWNRGKSSFFTDQNKYLYEGIETEVENVIRGSAVKGVISPQDLADPQTWQTAAQLLRLQRGEMDRLQKKAGMSAVNVEKPGNSKIQDEDDIVLDDNDRDFMRKNNISEKEAKERIRIALNAERTGKSTRRGN
jgi:hypothetical protein